MAEINNEELNLLNAEVRTQILEGLKSEDNRNRKRDQQKRYDVYNGQQDRYILERLRREFSNKTVQEMRKIFSINLAKRIIDEKSSVYTREPERVFSTRSGAELNEAQLDLLDRLYEFLPVNIAMSGSNVKENLHDQCALMCVPDMEGGYKVRPIAPMHYDVVPSMKNPEKAYAYILNVWNKDVHMKARNNSTELTQLRSYKGSNFMNETIADDDDYQAVMDRFIVWTPEYHFTMNGHGEIIGEVIDNPIGRLPFVDVARPDKDFQFFIRRGSNTVDFSLDFGMMLSDNANVIRLQSYSQAVIVSEKLPTNTTVGPNHVMHLKLDRKNPALTPTFQFVTPNPDLAGTQAFLESLLNLHLTSMGLDPAVLSTEGEAQKFNSGLDRLLSMISKFEATRDDFALFSKVEDEYLDIISKWSNHFQNVTGDGELAPEFKGPQLPDDIQVDVKFAEPEDVQTKAEKEASLLAQRKEGLKSRIHVLMAMHGVSEDKAIEIAQEVDEHEKLYGMGRMIEEPDVDEVEEIEETEEGDNGGTDIQEDESTTDDQP